MDRRHEVIDRVIEICLYIYFIFMFLTKGESIRNITLFTAFILWLATLGQRADIRTLKHPVSILFWLFIASAVISAVFSIDPRYSIASLKDQPLKSVAIFCLMSTVFADEKRLKRLTYLTFPILVFTISVGYYSYFAYDLPIMKPVTTLRHAWHARFATDINTLLPFTFILLLITARVWFKAVLGVTMVAGISAIMLSTSRAGSAAFLVLVVIWLLYLSKRHNLSVMVPFVSLGMIVILLGSMILYAPSVREKYFRLRHDVKTLTDRTDIWRPLIASAMDRPLLGWGYGPEIFTLNMPFEGTDYKTAPVVQDPVYRNPHNAFLRTLFHQGVTGMVIYILLLLLSVGTFWKASFGTTGFIGYVLLSCTGIVVSIYIINAMIESSHLTHLSLILGIGLATRQTGLRTLNAVR